MTDPDTHHPRDTSDTQSPASESPIDGGSRTLEDEDTVPFRRPPEEDLSLPPRNSQSFDAVPAALTDEPTQKFVVTDGDADDKDRGEPSDPTGCMM